MPPPPPPKKNQSHHSQSTNEFVELSEEEMKKLRKAARTGFNWQACKIQVKFGQNMVTILAKFEYNSGKDSGKTFFFCLSI